jgi:hypothetical protein
MAVESLTKEQYDSVIERLLQGTSFSDISTDIVAQGADKTWFDALETNFTMAMLKRRAFSDTYGFAGSDRQWAEVAWAQITPAPSGTYPATFDTEGGEEIIIVGSMFSPGCTATIGAEDITILSQTPGTILGITPAHAAAANLDVVVTSAEDNAGTLTPGPAYAKKTPTVTSITPNSGPAAGGSRHIVTGTKFCPGVTATIGGHACTVELLDEQHFALTTPAHAAGALNLVVTNVNAEAATKAGFFTYV